VVVIGTLIPELFFAKFGTFLAFLGVGFAPLCGIRLRTTSFGATAA
jgi:NCS1 family nucleobase:cation symporter-1